MNDHPTLGRAPEHCAPEPADTDTAFVDLLSADKELLRIEFDEIIAANFPSGDGRQTRCPPRRPEPPVADRPRPAAPASREATACGKGFVPPDVTANRRARQRSPPLGVLNAGIPNAIQPTTPRQRR